MGTNGKGTLLSEAKLYQWHPAFFAGIQIELQDDADNLTFENEHQLGTKPMEIDVLVIKKKTEKPIQKNIGRLFRKHNIIEYKGPSDYLSVDDFYKVYGYACFYKSESDQTNAIKIGELTITMVCFRYPQKLMHHLEEEQGCRIEQKGCGIYYIYGERIPIQIIVTKELSEEENLWLKSLTNDLTAKEQAKYLVEEYGKHGNNRLYESVMNIVVRANQETFQEVKNMCEALRELMKDELEEREKAGRKAGEELGKAIGEELGKELGKDRVNALILRLAQEGRNEEIVKAAGNKEYQQRLFEEFGI